MMRLHSARALLRNELFSGTSRRRPDQAIQDEKLVSMWEKYIELNVSLPAPGMASAFAELKQMVDTHITPEYPAGGQAKKPIPSRELSDMELTKLRELMGYV